jgi:hypothetical protein
MSAKARSQQSCTMLLRCAALAGLADFACGQVTLEDLRREFSDAVAAERYPAFLAALIGLNSEAHFSGARLDDDSDPSTSFQVYSYPWRRDVADGPWGRRWQLEATAGFTLAEWSVRNALAAGGPQSAVDIDTRFRVFGLTLGAGPVFELGERWELRPSVEVGVSYVDNRARYAGPGAAALSALSDGILFNWNATYALYGASVMLRREPWTWRELAFEPLLRVDARWSEALVADDAAQEESTSTGWSVAALDVSGDAGFTVAGQPVGWGARLGYKRLFEEAGELIGFHDYFELGGRLELNTRDALPVLASVGLHGAVIIGEDVNGWTAGLSASL